MSVREQLNSLWDSDCRVSLPLHHFQPLWHFWKYVIYEIAIRTEMPQAAFYSRGKQSPGAQKMSYKQTTELICENDLEKILELSLRFLCKYSSLKVKNTCKHF